jgi:outer membrane receptor protein involved in Fe transport
VTYVPPNGYSANDHIIKLNTSYKITDGLNAYINYAEGFRRGGANGIPLTGPFAVNSSLQVYTPDKTKNYEIGVKGRAPGINYTIDYFYINWNNFQLDTQSYAGGYSLAANGAKARSQGVEMTLDGELAAHFNYSIGYTYTRAQLAEDFSILDNLDDGSGGQAAIVSGKKGDALPNAPRHSATLGLTYTQPALAFLPDWIPRWHLNGSYRSATLSRLVNTVPGSTQPFEIKGFSVWDAALEVANKSGLYASLYADNIFNELAITGGLDPGQVAPGNGGVRGSYYYIGRPRTLGLRVGYKFR